MSAVDVAGVPAEEPVASGQKLSPFTVYLRRRGGRTRGRIAVQAASQEHAERVAVRQCIEVSYPKTKPAQWIVTSVEVVKP